MKKMDIVVHITDSKRWHCCCVQLVSIHHSPGLFTRRAGLSCRKRLRTRIDLQAGYPSMKLDRNGSHSRQCHLNLAIRDISSFLHTTNNDSVRACVRVCVRAWVRACFLCLHPSTKKEIERTKHQLHGSVLAPLHPLSCSLLLITAHPNAPQLIITHSPPTQWHVAKIRSVRPSSRQPQPPATINISPSVAECQSVQFPPAFSLSLFIYLYFCRVFFILILETLVVVSWWCHKMSAVSSKMAVEAVENFKQTSG